MGSKIDLLTKSELEYELKLRNVEVDSKSTVTSMRKRLRKCTKELIETNVKNLEHKINVKDEILFIEVSLKVLTARLTEINAESRPVDILRFEAKSEHLKLRMTNLNCFKLTPDVKGTLEKYLLEITTLDEKFSEINSSVDSNIKEGLLRRLSETNIEEETLDDVFDNLDEKESKQDGTNEEMKIDGAEVKEEPKLESSHQTTSRDISSGEENSIFENSQYAKLPNPVIKYFETVSICDGLNVETLLKFLNVLLRLKSETSLTNGQVLEMCQHYCSGPLLGKILECKSTHKDLDIFHREVLFSFVPIGLRESLKRDLVTKPQNLGEPLHAYICRVKENSKLLRCTYTETELVQLICMNINQEERSRLVFMPQPKCFADLNELCIQSQNVSYANWERDNVFGKHRLTSGFSKPTGPNPKMRNINNLQPVNPLICYNCNRPGHLARNCFRPKQPRNMEQRNDRNNSKERKDSEENNSNREGSERNPNLN